MQAFKLRRCVYIADDICDHTHRGIAAITGAKVRSISCVYIHNSDQSLELHGLLHLRQLGIPINLNRYSIFDSASIPTQRQHTNTASLTNMARDRMLDSGDIMFRFRLSCAGIAGLSC